METSESVELTIFVVTQRSTQQTVEKFSNHNNNL